MSKSIDIGSRRELFVDDYLIDKMDPPLKLQLHQPQPQEVALTMNRPWEGNMCGFITVMEDNGRFRMYYKGHKQRLNVEADQENRMVEAHPLNVCVAESGDGITWERPQLDIVDHEGETGTNIIWEGVGETQKGIHGFAPFKDPNPAASDDAKYKAVGGIRRALHGDLYAMVSSDGLHWTLREDPIMEQGRHGAFDSQNLAFWDPVNGIYRAYMRKGGGPVLRNVATATSEGFVNWSESQLLDYPGAPAEQLYTNQVMPYPRAPHILVGFPTRYIEREWSPAIEQLPELEHRRLRAEFKERYGSALTDGLFMSSRDGQTFKRWGEAFIRPGPQLEGNWAYGDNYQCWGMIETESDLSGAPSELSFYATENYWRQPSAIRRYALRMDGFVSVKAPLSGGEFVTEPVVFDGSELEINLSTSAAGSVRVEIQNDEGTPISGFSLDDCHEQIGDELDRAISWNAGRDLSSLSGDSVRLRFVMSDADLYSLRFRR